MGNVVREQIRINNLVKTLQPDTNKPTQTIAYRVSNDIWQRSQIEKVASDGNCLLEAILKQSGNDFKDQQDLRKKLSISAYGINDKRTHNYIQFHLSQFFDEPKLLNSQGLPDDSEFTRMTKLIREDRNWNMQFFDIVIPIVASRLLKKSIEIYQLNSDVERFDPTIACASDTWSNGPFQSDALKGTIRLFRHSDHYWSIPPESQENKYEKWINPDYLACSHTMNPKKVF